MTPVPPGRSKLGVRTSTAHTMPIRYMGTKRRLAPLVRHEVEELRVTGPVADLFSGLGSVARAMASDFPVVVNDALSFTVPLARARFTDTPRPRAERVLRSIYPEYKRRLDVLTSRFSRRIACEAQAIEQGPLAVSAYLETVEHVGNSERFRRRARAAAGRRDGGRYVLVTLYYSGGYFSTRQAIELDALRLAIDRYGSSRDWLLAAWLAAAGTVINSPGHTAQFLKPTSQSAFDRIRRQWIRAVWPVFVAKLDAIFPVGTRAWRQANSTHNHDALQALSRGALDDARVVYADPPYTKDQYSRYYHLYETLFRYNFPTSSGAGRYPGGRFTSAFSLATGVEAAFRHLLRDIATLGVPLILSYPLGGLLAKRGVDIRDLLRCDFEIARQHELVCQHSTMGASKGRSRLPVIEQLFVCLPRTNLRSH